MIDSNAPESNRVEDHRRPDSLLTVPTRDTIMLRHMKTSSPNRTLHRDMSCGELRKEQIGQRVKLAGWVHRVRDHGGITFVDLRDNYGLTQVVFDPAFNASTHAEATRLKPESVIFLEGEVRARTPETVNPDLPTGEIEVFCEVLVIDSVVASLPFPIADESKQPEELRLKYRFLDLRRDRLHRNILYRSEVISEIRHFMTGAGFREFQTPILTVSSPEGARDYLVPSRLHPGKFYALPQAPQQYKQLIMCAGFDKYFQVAPCFRDEASRADRSPGEFYQLDIEMSYISQDDLFQVLEALFAHLVPKLTKKTILQMPFPRLTYLDTMNWYGTDKPDIRYEMKMTDVSDIFAGSTFKVFASNAVKGRCVKALVLENSATNSRSFFDKLEEFAKSLGAKGLAYINVLENEMKSPILKFLSEAEIAALKDRLKLKPGDTVFFSAGPWLESCKVLGEIRRHLGQEIIKPSSDTLAFCWIVDFPMFEYNEEEKRIDFSHNPFSMPQGGMEALLEKDPLTIMAYQYDIVCNGIELSSGAIRNHRPDIMYKAFEIAGYPKEAVDEKFGHMIRAFTYGAPPHGGIAPGVDRIVMIFADEPNIREVTTFPMNQKAQELMVGSPSEVTMKQLRELHLKVDIKEPKKEAKPEPGVAG